MNWRCFFRHRWGAWSESVTQELYANFYGNGSHVELTTKPTTFGVPVGRYRVKERRCERCGKEDMSAKRVIQV